MFKISHRGNLDGPDPEKENSPCYIKDALDAGYDCEVDVWYINERCYSGHDKPVHDFLFNILDFDIQKLWFHAKNLDALYMLNKCGVNVFWHQEDNFTLTSNGYIWTYPGKPLTDNSILVTFDKPKTEVFHSRVHFPASGADKIAGICSDYIGEYKI